jgi:cell wall-associated NlpC family hydrolase
MMNALKYGIATIVLVAFAIKGADVRKNRRAERQMLAYNAAAKKDTILPERIVTYAQTLIGTPYSYGCSKPESGGFDCSGFINYVFQHFNLTVPRSSADFANVGQEVSTTREAKQGDLILFTGTNPAIRTVGHIGIVISNADSLRFIHSSSGKEYAVTITPLNDYYQGRFMKVVRVFDAEGNLAL